MIVINLYVHGCRLAETRMNNVLIEILLYMGLSRPSGKIQD